MDEEKFKEKLGDFMSELNPLNDEIIKLKERISVLEERKQKLISKYLEG